METTVETSSILDRGRAELNAARTRRAAEDAKSRDYVRTTTIEACVRRAANLGVTLTAADVVLTGEGQATLPAGLLPEPWRLVYDWHQHRRPESLRLRGVCPGCGEDAGAPVDTDVEIASIVDGLKPLSDFCGTCYDRKEAEEEKQRAAKRRPPPPPIDVMIAGLLALRLTIADQGKVLAARELAGRQLRLDLEQKHYVTNRTEAEKAAKADPAYVEHETQTALLFHQKDANLAQAEALRLRILVRLEAERATQVPDGAV